MSASPLPQNNQGELLPAMQRRLAQLQCAMGGEVNAPVPIGPAPIEQARKARSVAPKDASDTSKARWAVKSTVMVSGLLLAGLLTGVLSQHPSAASATPESPSADATLTGQSSPPAVVLNAPAPTTRPTEDEAIRDMLERWRLDWSRRDVSAYLGHYSTRFEPATGVDRDKWASQRQQALLNRPAIRIELHDLRIERPDPLEARVRFLQTYLSGQYQEHAQPKTMQLLHEDGGWRIAGEWQGAGPWEHLSQH